MRQAAPGYQKLEALAYRDRLTRFSGGSVGPYWAQLTPLVWIGFLVVLFHFLQRVPPIHTHSAIFVATGVLPYILFRQTITSLARTVIANRHLRYIHSIGHQDILNGTTCVEGCNILFSAILVFGLLVAFGYGPQPNDLSQVIGAFGLLFIFSISFGRFVAVIGLMSDSWARIFPLALRPFFWISGVFYTATELPKSVQDLLWWNPLLHITEALRQGYFAAYQSPVLEALFPVLCACFLFLVSIFVERHMLDRVEHRYRL